MTKRKHLKKRTRDRQAETGESYKTARTNTLAGDGRICAACRGELEEREAGEAPGDLSGGGQLAGTKRYCPRCESAATKAEAGASAPFLGKFEWHPLVKTTAAEAVKLVEEAIRRVPGLGVHAIDQFSDAGTWEWREFRGNNFVTSLAAVGAAADWIAEQKQVRTFNAKHSIAEYCHIIERLLEVRGGPSIQVLRGCLLAAALGKGLETKQRKRSGGEETLLKLSEAGVRRFRGEISAAVIEGRGVTNLRSWKGDESERWWAGAFEPIIHFSDLEELTFVGVVDAKDPEGGPFTRYADLPIEGLEEARTSGFRALTDRENSRLEDDDVVIGEIEDYSGPKHSD